MTREEAAAAGVDEELRRRWVRWTNPKSNYAPALPDRWLWREAGGVLRARDLDTGDQARRIMDESKATAKRRRDRANG